MSGVRHAMIWLCALAMIWTGSAVRTLAQDPGSDLQKGFREPPDSAKPRVWWHWMNGNVTKEGITADLEWMKRVGIAGMQMFDGNLGTPQQIALDTLTSWIASSDPGVKYFSGTAPIQRILTYRKSGSDRERSLRWTWAV